MEHSMESTDTAELEIRIFAPQPATATSHRVEIRVGGLDGTSEPPAGMLDTAALPVLADAPEEQGERLFDTLFADEVLRTAWAEARAAHPRRRLRLRIDEGAARELHDLPWELLREPACGTEPARFLAADGKTPFSRYLAQKGKPGMPVLDRPLRLLAVIVDAPGLPSDLPRIDVEVERAALEKVFAEAAKATRSELDLQLDVSWLTGAVTLEALGAELQKGPHVLHLVAHGGFDNREQEGTIRLAAHPEDTLATNGSRGFGEDELAALLGNLATPLRLVFLASCYSAARSPADTFRGVARRLMDAGVPAVVGMQDKVDMATARSFAASFYKQLLDHGRVDQAANEARALVLATPLPGPHMPVLLLRLRDGRLLDHRGEIQGDAPETFWGPLVRDVHLKKCIAILGPGILGGNLPLPADLARHLAGAYNYPFADASDLPRVAQFVGNHQPFFAHEEVLGLLIRQVRKLWAEPERPEGGLRNAASLTAALRASAWLERSREKETEIHHQLAGLGLPVYLTTNCDPLMTLALEHRGVAPQRRRLAWRETLAEVPELPAEDCSLPQSLPNAASPLVLHLFGTDEVTESLVLTEDDHLDFLTAMSRSEKWLLPGWMQDALSTHTLLFLGFHLRDLNFKVLLRGLRPPGVLRDYRGRGLRVAVQIDPEDVKAERRQQARGYFENYFRESGEIRVYWGSARRFVTDLCSQVEKERHE